MINRIAVPLLRLPRAAKRLLALCVDASLCTLTVWLALCLRLDSWSLPEGNQWFAIWLSPIVALPIFVTARLYRAIFGYSGLAAITALGGATFVYGAIYATILVIFSLPGVTRSSGFLQPFVLVFAVGSS